MPDKPKQDGRSSSTPVWLRVLVWVSGAWTLPLLTIGFWILPASVTVRTILAILAILAAPLPALLYIVWQRRRLIAIAAKAEEDAAQLRLQLDTVRYRTARLREELQAADRQARLSHQLTLLGQFTAGFMHEFNNPLAIVAGRLEVLLEERKEDAALVRGSGADAQRNALHEQDCQHAAAGSAARTRWEVFEAPIRRRLWKRRCGLEPTAAGAGSDAGGRVAEAPRVDVPEHVVAEVVRGLLSNALHALKGRDGGDDLVAAGALSNRRR